MSTCHSATFKSGSSAFCALVPCLRDSIAAQICSGVNSTNAGMREGAVTNLATSSDGMSFKTLHCSSTSDPSLSCDCGGNDSADMTSGNQLFDAPSKIVRASSSHFADSVFRRCG